MFKYKPTPKDLLYRSKCLPPMSLRERFAWVAQAPNPSEIHRRRAILLDAHTAIGGGPLEARLTRLMVWVGSKLHSGPVHNGLVDPFALLASTEAWCDQQTKVFMFFTWHLLQTDSHELALRHSDGSNGHAVVEVFYDNSRHLFDVHSEHQAIYRHPTAGHIMSYEELERDQSPVLAEQHWWRGNDGRGKEGFYSAGGSAINYYPTSTQGYLALYPETMTCNPS